MSERRATIVLAVIAAVFIARIVATYRVFNDTIDENDHIEAGMDYLDRGVYEYEPQHPPLARLAVGFGPYYLSGLRFGDQRVKRGRLYSKPLSAKRELHETFLWAGPWRLGTDEEYWSSLSLARAGVLPFALLLLGVVYGWAKDLWGPQAGLASALVISCSPTVLAHSALATLDTAAATTMVAAAYSFWRWTVHPSAGRAALAGLATAAAIASKFSALAFLPPILLFYLWLNRKNWRTPGELRTRRVREALAYSLVAVAAVWSVYRFDHGPIAPPGRIYISPHESDKPAETARALASFIGSTSVPAPALLRGVIDVVAHNDEGHGSYLLGQWSEYGSPWYFFVALGLKTTAPLLILVVVGVAMRWRQDWPKLAAAMGLGVCVLAVGGASSINIGVRHILAVYPSLAIVAGAAFSNWTFDRKKWTALAPAILLLLHGAESVRAHPDYLAYFNQAALGGGQRYLLDSNLDWGQDLARLGGWMEETATPSVILRYFGEARPERFGIHTFVFDSDHPDAGWFAISANYLFGIEGSSPALRELAAAEPEARVGKSIWIYRIDQRRLPDYVPPWFFENYVLTDPPPGYEPTGK